jgi:hypothetical protein
LLEAWAMGITVDLLGLSLRHNEHSQW